MTSRSPGYSELSFTAFIGQFKLAIFAMIVVLVLSLLVLDVWKTEKVRKQTVFSRTNIGELISARFNNDITEVETTGGIYFVDGIYHASKNGPIFIERRGSGSFYLCSNGFIRCKQLLLTDHEKREIRTSEVINALCSKQKNYQCNETKWRKRAKVYSKQRGTRNGF